MGFPLGLPRFVLLNAYNGKFVRQTDEFVVGSLRTNGEDVTNQDIKFELEPTKIDIRFFHIRSCSNNKYWRMESHDSLYFTAAADKPNEDRFHWSCTLFEPFRAEEDGGDNKLIIRLRSIYNNAYVRGAGGPLGRNDSLYAMADGYGDEFRVTDAESLLILPKTVAFKASNGKYLQPYPGRITACATDIGNAYVSFHITYNNPDGYARLTCKENNLVVYNAGSGVLVTLDGSDRSPPSFDDKNAMFKPIKVAGPKFKDGKVVASATFALRCAANNHLVRCDSARDDNVFADASSITHDAVFSIDEPVLSRRIYNVNFHLANSRIYDETIVSLVTKQVSNFNKEPQVEHLTLKYEQKTTSTFDRTVSASVGVDTSFQTGIPFIAEGQIDVSVNVEGSLGWHDTTEKTQDLETTQDVTVDPMTTVIANILATKGKCDVPFSYTQSDTLFDGNEVITGKDDGVYRGVSSWNFHCETTTKPLLPKA